MGSTRPPPPFIDLAGVARSIDPFLASSALAIAVAMSSLVRFLLSRCAAMPNANASSSSAKRLSTTGTSFSLACLAASSRVWPSTTTSWLPFLQTKSGRSESKPSVFMLATVAASTSGSTGNRSLNGGLTVSTLISLLTLTVSSLSLASARLIRAVARQ